MIRIGQGFDVHKLVPERKLILGGVDVPCDRGLQGHSDADVLTHAIMDSLLGSLALGDIGQWFPDDDPRFQDANSIQLLEQILQAREFANSNLLNLDCTIIAQAPKLAGFIPEMRTNLANAFNTEISQISIKASTTEKLGFCGREEGIAAMAVILLEQT